MRIRIPHAYRPVHRRFEPPEIEIAEYIAVSFMIRPVGMVGIEDSVGKAAGLPHDRYGSVFHRDHLGKATGFEEAGDEHHVGTRIDQMGQIFVEAYFYMTVRIVVELMFEAVEMVVYLRIRARPEQYKLTAV